MTLIKIGSWVSFKVRRLGVKSALDSFIILTSVKSRFDPHF
jgi:hypothetical protein